MRSLLLVLSVASTVTAFASSVLAQSQPGLEEALQGSNYPTGSNEALCYAKTDAPSTFDLSRLCGLISKPMLINNTAITGASYNRLPSDSSTYSGNSYRNFSSGSTSSGVCNVPSDIARDSSRCGGRAASER
ncbi:MAG: hypothetical protein RM049_26700 [Nostoc sp. DedQUE04]|uniref:hypothetical protein n=1 Tax=Nostoc sp. DedQUE04 TaxID=3075390 RepID=UPI002AD5093D|nr:hypothetical protein [Nostoc sp. DedQUE04]MDZ8138850.1 hypothetical protein [Nostoc sp. DedQUE04]